MFAWIVFISRVPCKKCGICADHSNCICYLSLLCYLSAYSFLDTFCRYNLKKLTYEERKAKLIERLNALNSAAGNDDDDDEDDE